jgi:hypothetical protein
MKVSGMLRFADPSPGDSSFGLRPSHFCFNAVKRWDYILPRPPRCVWREAEDATYETVTLATNGFTAAQKIDIGGTARRCSKRTPARIARQATLRPDSGTALPLGAKAVKSAAAPIIDLA